MRRNRASFPVFHSFSCNSWTAGAGFWTERSYGNLRRTAISFLVRSLVWIIRVRNLPMLFSPCSYEVLKHLLNSIVLLIFQLQPSCGVTFLLIRMVGSIRCALGFVNTSTFCYLLMCWIMNFHLFSPPCKQWSGALHEERTWSLVNSSYFIDLVITCIFLAISH